MRFHDWRDALAYAFAAARVSGLPRRVHRDPVDLVWCVDT